MPSSASVVKKYLFRGFQDLCYVPKMAVRVAGYSMLGAGFQLSGLYNLAGFDRYIDAPQPRGDTSSTKKLADMFVQKAREKVKSLTTAATGSRKPDESDGSNQGDT